MITRTNGACQQCGKVFAMSQYGKTKRFCSGACTAAYRRTHADSRNYPACTCKQCGTVFTPKAIDRITFCGQPCGYAWKKAQNKHNECRVAHTKIGYCIDCGIPHKRTTALRKRCSQCAREYTLVKGREGYYREYIHDSGDVTCVECGKVVHKEKRASVSKYCSQKCMNRAWKREHNGNHRKRARKYAVGYDSTCTLKELMIRDGVRCQMCGHKVKRTRRHHERRATLGHIKALSKGGSHTWDNVQLECWICNTKHGDTTHGQRRLVM